MQLAGGEERIPALFCELSHEDQSIAPRFEKVWSRAAASKPQSVRAFNRSLVLVASACAIVGICSLVLSLRFTSIEQVPPVILKPETMFTMLPPSKNEKVLYINRKKTHGRKRRFEPAVTQETISLSSWRSPTEMFMKSTPTPVWNSLPPLNQSAKELESFLPYSDGKESKQ